MSSKIPIPDGIGIFVVHTIFGGRTLKAQGNDQAEQRILPG